MMPQINTLLDNLLKNQKINHDYKEILLMEQQRSQRSLESLLLDMGIITEEELLELLARFRQCTIVSLNDYRVSIAQLHNLISSDILQQTFSIPIYCDYQNANLTIAMADISDIQSYDLLLHHIPQGYQVVTVLAKKSHILTALQDFAPPPNIQSTGHYTIDDQVINEFLYKIIVEAVRLKASDIHFEPEKFLIRVRYRRDGLLQTMYCFHEAFWQPFCVQLKILSSMDIAETRRPQDGRFSFPMMGRSVDFRVSCHPTLHGENIVLRVLDKEKSLIPLEKLGYSPWNLQAIHRLLKKPEGIIVMTGPTGSGKTTSLYSMLSILNKEQINIMTLEEPIEYYLPHIRQSEVRDQSSFTFTTGMHSILRQDPDVILIGEIRDEPTADMAIRAGMTGHVVLTTLHTTHALGTIYRLMELKVPLSLLTGVLNGIVAQRLVRLLCPLCKVPKDLTPQEAKEYCIWPQVTVYQAKGCSFCSSLGYKGRKAIAEVIMMSPDLEERILEQAPYSELQRCLFQKGFKNLKSDALSSVLNGETSLEEVQRVLGII